MIANYLGQCPNCRGLIEPGEEITREDQGWVHAECQGLERVRPF